MSDETTTAGRPSQRSLRPDLRERILTQRWVLGAALVLAVVAHRSGAVPMWAALGGFAIIVIAALFAPQRRKAAIRRLREARAVTPWPDTGMKRIAEALHNPCFIVDHRGITRYVNRAAQERFGDPHPGDRSPSAFARQSSSTLWTVSSPPGSPGGSSGARRRRPSSGWRHRSPRSPIWQGKRENRRDRALSS